MPSKRTSARIACAATRAGRLGMIAIVPLAGCSRTASPAAEAASATRTVALNAQSPEPTSGQRAPSRIAVVHGQPKPLAPDAVTSNWPRFLGPTNDGKSPETHLLKEFPLDGPPLVWEMETGEGYACPAVANGKLVYLHRIGNEEVVECLHPEAGERFWSARYATRYRDRYGFGNGPRAGPVIDGDRVYTVGPEGKLHCFDLETGEVVWKLDIADTYQAPLGFFGYGSSPLVEGELLIVVVGAPGGPTVVALDKKSGEEVWRSGSEWGVDYASPIAGVVHGKRRVFVLAGGDRQPPTGGLLSIDPAGGSIDCRFEFRSAKYESVNAASPVILGDQVFISSSYNTGGVLVRMSPDAGCEQVWRTDSLRCHFATPISRDGYLYGFDGMNKRETVLACVELATGRQVWREQPSWTETLTTNRGQQEVELGVYRGSLIETDGRFLCLGEMGHLLWLDLSPAGYKELSRTRLFYAEETWSPPVLSRGLLYIAQNSKDTLTGKPPRLLCYDLRPR